ncbi:FecR family protein [[Pseudomonas] boreopolis]|uniref:FecR family protein n=1 Tax=Xanthomonas boreopolis TaxID=86183 RepID=UPI003D9AD9F3
MNPSDERIRTVSPLEREAYAWIALLTSGQATAADADALKAWCAISEEHRAAFAKAQRLWRQIGSAGQDVANWKPLAAPGAARGRGGPLLRRRAFIGGALAAPAALVALAAWRPPLGLWPSLDELRADYRTSTGERRQVQLAGRAVVEMDAQTSLRVADGPVQAMELVAGRAGVRLSGARPFTIRAGNGCVVLDGDGARVDVWRSGERVQVSCLAGTARVEHAGPHVLNLQARQQVAYTRDAIGGLVAVDPADVAAWQQGVLVFRQAALAQVVDELNRYRPGRVVILDDQVARQPVSGRFSVDDPDAVIEQLRLALNLDVHAYPGGVVLLA